MYSIQNMKVYCLFWFPALLTSLVLNTSVKAEEVSNKSGDLMGFSTDDQNRSNLLSQSSGTGFTPVEPSVVPTPSFTTNNINPDLPARNYWYGSGNIGFSSQSDVGVSTGGRKQGNQSFSNGFLLNGAVGYQFEEVRTELEIGTRFFSGNSFSDPNGRKVSSTGNITATSVLINGYYDIPTSSKLRPYIGAGLGLAFTSGDIDIIDIGGNSFAYNLKGGIQYEVNYKGNIFAELKYASIGGYKLKNTNADIDSVNSFGLSIGYRQGF